MAKFPVARTTDVWECSDRTRYWTEEEAKKHQDEISLLALCNEIFGEEGSGHYGSLSGSDVCRGLLEHRALFVNLLAR